VLRIAVCDNEEQELNRLEAQIEDYAQQSDENIKWTGFKDSKELLESLQRGEAYDVALLDILMPGLSGIELGKYIREQCPDMGIIYTTTSRDFALEAFENHALRYLLKPVEQTELFSALDLAGSLRKKKQEPIVIKSSDGMVMTTPDQVILVENVDRCVQYQLTDGRKIRTVSRRSRLDELVAPLPDRPEFLKPHNSFWVNMNYISELKKEELIMDNGAIVPISRTRLQEVKRSYFHFLETMGGRFGE